MWHRAYPARALHKIIIATVASSAAGALLAQTALPQLAPVLVSATRFASDVQAGPVAATVISAEQIRASGVDNVNQAIRSIAGVYGRQNSNGSADYTLDLRGFGATASQNMVILIDGVRLNENELSVALLSSIPIETVERIEIVRGGSSVLYGEGATAGTIAIITKRPQHNAARGTIVSELGSYGRRSVRAALARDWDGLALDLNLSRLQSDNYRDNNRLQQENGSVGLQWGDARRRLGVRFDHSDQHYRNAGSLTLAQFIANPRSSNTPDDDGATRLNRSTLFGEQQWGAYALAFELSQRDKVSAMHSVSHRYGLSVTDSGSRSRTLQFSPRLRHSAAWAALDNTLVAGLDISTSRRDSVSNTVSSINSSTSSSGTQRARAVYARDEIRYGSARLALGVRREIFEQRSASALNSKRDYGLSQALNAWELQGSVAVLPAFNVFAKAGRSYRVANVDENGFTTAGGSMLQPQISNDLEFGGTLGSAPQQLTVRLFQARLRNEIMYDPTIANPSTGGDGANVNLAPTIRRGIELEAMARLSTNWQAALTLQHVAARFSEGVNQGNEITLVPRNIVSARLNWLAGRHSAQLGVQWVGSQRYGNDFANTCGARMPSYLSVDARYALKLGAWEWALAGSNLSDAHYFSQAYGCQSGIYSESGRQLNLSARYDF